MALNFSHLQETAGSNMTVTTYSATFAKLRVGWSTLRLVPIRYVYLSPCLGFLTSTTVLLELAGELFGRPRPYGVALSDRSDLWAYDRCTSRYSPRIGDLDSTPMSPPGLFPAIATFRNLYDRIVRLLIWCYEVWLGECGGQQQNSRVCHQSDRMVAALRQRKPSICTPYSSPVICECPQGITL